MRIRILASTFAVLLISAGMAQAQSPVTGPGPWISGTFGAGFAGMHCDQCLSRIGDVGPIAGFGAGWGLSNRVHLSATLQGWVRPLTGDRTHFANIDLLLSYAPLRHSNLFVALGGGVSRYVRRRTIASDLIRSTVSAPSFMLEVGYERRLTPNLVLAPSLTYRRGLNGDEEIDKVATGFRLHSEVLQGAITLRWHPRR